MDRLEQLREKLNQIVAKYEALLQERDRLKSDNDRLGDELKQAEKQQGRDESRTREKHAGAVRRISRLVDKIERLQGEIDFS